MLRSIPLHLLVLLLSTSLAAQALRFDPLVVPATAGPGVGVGSFLVQPGVTSDPTGQVGAGRILVERLVPSSPGDAVDLMVLGWVQGQARVLTNDGCTWTPWLAAGGGPPERTDFGMCVDDVEERLLLFGGRTPSGTVLGDTWIFSGLDGSWRQVLAAGGPSPRHGHALGGLVLFGGIDPSGGWLGDTWVWSWSAETWIRQPVSGPAPAPRASMAYPRVPSPEYERGSSGLTLFGGQTAQGPVDDLWQFSTSTLRWMELPAATRPPAGTDQALMEAAGGYVLWDPIAGEFWQYASQGWSRVGQPPSSLPPRSDHVAAYLQRPVVFGGRDAAGARDDLWEFDGLQWRPMVVTGGPGPLHSAAGIVGSSSLDVFGGIDATGTRSGELWRLRFSSWQRLTSAPGPAPSPRAGAVARAFGSNGLIVFGGDTAVGFSGETWTGAISGSTVTWTLASTAGPSARTDAMMGVVSGTVVLHGGRDASGAALDDTWNWDAASSTWRPAASSGVPRANGGSWERSSRSLLFAGGSGAGGTVERSVYEFDGTAWRNLGDLAHGAVDGLAVAGGGAAPLWIGGRDAAGVSADATLVTTPNSCGAVIGVPCPYDPFDPRTSSPISGTGQIFVGSSVALRYSVAFGTTGVVAMAIGSSRQACGVTPLPVPLAPFGFARGCQLRVCPEIVLTAVITGTQASFPVSVPPDPALAGAVFFAQGLEIGTSSGGVLQPKVSAITVFRIRP